MNYKIEYRYQTGNSFGHETLSEVLDFEWEIFHNAKENLQRIKEHYDMYSALSDVGKYSWQKFKTREEVLKLYEDKDWYAVSELKAWYPDTNGNLFRIDPSERHEKDKIVYLPDFDIVQNCLRLKLDNGNFVQFWAPWCGYFERLFGAKIILPKNNDLEFEF